MALAYEATTADLAESSCTHASIVNWIEFEYPLWPGLSHNGWKGIVDDTDVMNPTRKLESRNPPCATLSQQGPSYRTPDDGTVNLQFSDLALSVDADKATTMHIPAPGFTSSVTGVRVWPGGGWLLTAYKTVRVLDGNGSIYIVSRTDRSVQLHIELPPTEGKPALSVIGPDGRPVGYRS